MKNATLTEPLPRVRLETTEVGSRPGRHRPALSVEVQLACETAEERSDLLRRACEQRIAQLRLRVESLRFGACRVCEAIS